MKRWQIPLANFNNLIENLKTHSAEEIINSEDFLVLSGYVKVFEMSIESAWKTLQYWMQEEKLLDIETGPSGTVKAAFQNGYLTAFQFESWSQMIRLRNRTTHQYGVDELYLIVRQIEAELLSELKSLSIFLSAK